MKQAQWEKAKHRGKVSEYGFQQDWFESWLET